MNVVATAKDIRATPRKTRIVAAPVVGLPVAEALAVLAFSPRSAAREIAKVIKSAAANAEHNFNLDTSTLRVERIEVDGGIVFKGVMPMPRGRAGGLSKRTSHIRAYVTDEEFSVKRKKRSVIAMPLTTAPAPLPVAGKSAAKPARRRKAATAPAATSDAPETGETTTTATEKKATTPRKSTRKTTAEPSEGEKE